MILINGCGRQSRLVLSDRLLFMKRIESDQDFPDNPIQGIDGRSMSSDIILSICHSSPPVRAFIDAAYGMGLPKTP